MLAADRHFHGVVDEHRSRGFFDDTQEGTPGQADHDLFLKGSALFVPPLAVSEDVPTCVFVCKSKNFPLEESPEWAQLFRITIQSYAKCAYCQRSGEHNNSPLFARHVFPCLGAKTRTRNCTS